MPHFSYNLPPPHFLGFFSSRYYFYKYFLLLPFKIMYIIMVEEVRWGKKLSEPFIICTQISATLDDFSLYFLAWMREKLLGERACCVKNLYHKGVYVLKGTTSKMVSFSTPLSSFPRKQQMLSNTLLAKLCSATFSE